MYVSHCPTNDMIQAKLTVNNEIKGTNPQQMSNHLKEKCRRPYKRSQMHCLSYRYPLHTQDQRNHKKHGIQSGHHPIDQCQHRQDTNYDPFRASISCRQDFGNGQQQRRQKSQLVKSTICIAKALDQKHYAKIAVKQQFLKRNLHFLFRHNFKFQHHLSVREVFSAYRQICIFPKYIPYLFCMQKVRQPCIAAGSSEKKTESVFSVQFSALVIKYA